MPRRPHGSAIVATAAMLVFAAPTVRAGAPPLPDEDEATVDAPDPAIEDARKLYDRGRAKFETFDYLGAIELWTQAYEMLPDDDRYSEIRARLMFNLAA